MLSSVKDKEVIEHYKKSVDYLTETVEDFEPIELENIPHIMGPFTNWNYKSMREVIPFC